MNANPKPLIILFNPSHDDGGVEKILVNFG